MQMGKLRDIVKRRHATRKGLEASSQYDLPEESFRDEASRASRLVGLLIAEAAVLMLWLMAVWAVGGLG
jgi:hypothetical protein